MKENPNGEKKLLMRLTFYRFVVGFSIILIPIVGFAMLPILLTLIISAICIIQILLDLKLKSTPGTVINA